MSERGSWRDFMSSIKRGLTYSILASLPIGGLVFFFEVTQPAELRAEGALTTKLSNIQSFVQSPHCFRVARLNGISAEINAPRIAQHDVFKASDAEQALSASAESLQIGFQSEFVTKEGRRLAVRIVSRQPLGDQIVAGPAPAMAATPASTAKLVGFVWGPWRYNAELEDRGPEPAVVVQKLL